MKISSVFIISNLVVELLLALVLVAGDLKKLGGVNLRLHVVVVIRVLHVSRGEGGGADLVVVRQRVLLEVIGAGEALPAVITLVLPLPCVYSKVPMKLI